METLTAVPRPSELAIESTSLVDRDRPSHLIHAKKYIALGLQTVGVRLPCVVLKRRSQLGHEE
jgi:hypothetical protein